MDSNVHGKSLWDSIVAWYAFSDVYVDDDVRFGSAEFRFGGAESDTQAWM
jgi:hypothetical protein